MKLVDGVSHLDHELGLALVFIAEFFKSRESSVVRVETVELPRSFAKVPCALQGPAVGGLPVLDDEACLETRNGRPGPSRLCGRLPGRTWTITLVYGPYSASPDAAVETVLYTAYGGPQAPREPWDTSMSPEERAESVAFWAVHALSDMREV